MSSAYDFSRPEADSPFALAYRMAGYIKDARYIARYVAQEHGAHLAPTIKQVEVMQCRHEHLRKQARAMVDKRDSDKKLAYLGEVEPAQAVNDDQVAEPVIEQPVELPANSEPVPIFAHERIMLSVAKVFDLTPDDLRNHNRNAYLVTARAVAAMLLREQTFADGSQRYSLPQIGRMMNRDHSSIVHLTGTFHDRARKFPEMIEAYEALKGGAL